MKKTLFILITLITLVLTGCNNTNNPLETYAKENNIELEENTIVEERDYCSIDSIRYYENLLNNKSIELSKKIKANPYISNDSIIKYRKYGFMQPDINSKETNCTAYYGNIKGSSKLFGIYVMYDGRVITFDTGRNELMSLECQQIDFIKFVDGLIY